MNRPADARMIQVLRAQAWERAKGELRAVLVTYTAEPHDNHYNQMWPLVEDFIELIESNGYQE